MNTELVSLINSEIELANDLNDRVFDVLKERYPDTKFDIFRYSPICWRVKPKNSNNHSLSVVLETEGNYGKGIFIIGVDRFCRPSSNDLSKKSLCQALSSLSLRMLRPAVHVY